MHSCEVTFKTAEQLDIFIAWLETFGLEEFLVACEDEDCLIEMNDVMVD